MRRNRKRKRRKKELKREDKIFANSTKWFLILWYSCKTMVSVRVDRQIETEENKSSTYD